MAVVVVTVTSTVTVTPTSTQAPGDASSTLPAGMIAGIIIGTLIGGVILIVVVLYLLSKRYQSQFAWIVSPRHGGNARGSRALGGTPNQRGLLQSTGPSKKPWFPRHSRQPSATQPLMSLVTWPPHSPTPHVHFPDTVRRNTLSPGRYLPVIPGTGDSQDSFYDAVIDHYAETSQVVTSGTVAHQGGPAILNVPPTRKPEPELAGHSWPGTPPQALHPPDEATRASPHPVPSETYGTTSQLEPPVSPSIQSNPTPFIHRMLKLRAQVSEPFPLSRSLSYPESRSTSIDSSYDQTDEDKLLATAERTALLDAGAAHMVQPDVALEGDDGDEEEPESPASEYSQLSASTNHSATFSSEPPAPQTSSRSISRRKSSRRRARTPALSNELPPVAEAPDSPRAASPFAFSSSFNGCTLDHFPLLVSTAFGQSNSASVTSAGSISSYAGHGSSSSGRASRYPSLAPSSIGIGQSSGSQPRSEGSVDWHHPPAGLAALRDLQIGPMENPHSPIEQPLPPLPSDAPSPPSHPTSEHPT
ncbi:hypothetical protein BU15DRAFT_75667 [Melanogaster broomeanus]|nr:hypothetical protein BU15DRAFT_75667 [Melanogaster broomeanus]